MACSRLAMALAMFFSCCAYASPRLRCVSATAKALHARLDLADLREYQLHDDVRHIDWNVTARMQAPYVREFNEEREVAAWFFLDLSPSVDFGSESVRKRAVSSEFVTVLARLLTRHGYNVEVKDEPKKPASTPATPAAPTPQ